MKGGEAKFWNELRIPLKSMGDVDRLESHETSIGRPDVNICLDPGIIWDIELKYSDNGRVVMRPAQYGWFRRRGRLKANIAVFTKAVTPQGVFYMWHRRPPEEKELDEWVVTATHIWDHEVDFAELEGMLRAEEPRQTQDTL